jgi:cytidylate kinase
MLDEERNPYPEQPPDPQNPQSPRRPIIAIDGPAGAGKSTVARHLARFFGLLNLESGAMYRAFALKAQRCGIGLDDVDGLVALCKRTSIHLEPRPQSAEQGNLVFLDNEDVTGYLRSPDITDGASRVSVHPAVRAWMVRLQQELGAEGGLVMEGRDIGTVVFPNADVKIFLDAAPEVRGLRRYDQIGQAGQTGLGDSAKVDEVQPEEVIRGLRERDARDRNRANSPLRAAEDAMVVDSTYMSLEEVVAKSEEIVMKKLGIYPSQKNA